MEFEINQTPFHMEQVMEKLFDSPFLSDITFNIGDKQIHAHSFILMLRSSVFQKQLESTLGDKKAVLIADYDFYVFHRFIRFIYTDEDPTFVPASKQNYELLKLARKYNVVRLVDHIINTGCCEIMDKLNFCVVEKYEVALHSTKLIVQEELHNYLHPDKFLSIHPHTVEEILKMNEISKKVKETDMIDALVRWMNHYCSKDRIQFRQCSEKFSYLIQSIRFSSLTKKELRDVVVEYSDLFTNSRLQDIAMLKIYGNTPRMEFISPYDRKCFSSNSRFQTKFKVTSDLILSGFVFGSSSHSSSQNITISRQHENMNIIVIDVNRLLSNSVVVGLGASIRLTPHFTYTIMAKVTNSKTEVIRLRVRKPQTNLIVKAPQNTVKILEAHLTMLELHFLEPDNVKKLNLYEEIFN